MIRVNSPSTSWYAGTQGLGQLRYRTGERDRTVVYWYMLAWIYYVSCALLGSVFVVALQVHLHYMKNSGVVEP